jgi:hypothetical protein
MKHVHFFTLQNHRLRDFDQACYKTANSNLNRENVMKIALIVSAFVLSANAALACTKPEAQFIGVVTDYNNCSFKIKFTDYKESMACALDIEEAASTTFNDASCSLKDNDQVSGYLVVQDGKVVID